jgi:hypothetical protein
VALDGCLWTEHKGSREKFFSVLDIEWAFLRITSNNSILLVVLNFRPLLSECFSELDIQS